MRKGWGRTCSGGALAGLAEFREILELLQIGHKSQLVYARKMFYGNKRQTKGKPNQMKAKYPLSVGHRK